MKIRAIGAEMLHADGRTDEERDVRRLIVLLAYLRTRLKNALITGRYNSKNVSPYTNLNQKKKVTDGDASTRRRNAHDLQQGSKIGKKKAAERR